MNLERVNKRWEGHGTPSLGASRTDPAAVYSSLVYIIQQVFERRVDVQVFVGNVLYGSFDPFVLPAVLVPDDFFLYPSVGY